ncbi:hypothetical protein [Nonomuraea sp. NPDC050643]|uniref:hypothetical protein n=1 Tax=Nonomuraea sp. NPDC050643 TaxID=3155660 RepID=UPI0033EAD216
MPHATPVVHDLATGTEVVIPEPPGTGTPPPEPLPTNATAPKPFQVTVTGGPLRRYSCNRGEQSFFAAGEGAALVWLDGTATDTDLVTRDGPAHPC